MVDLLVTFKFPTRRELLRTASDVTAVSHDQTGQIVRLLRKRDIAVITEQGLNSLERQKLGVLIRMGLQLIFLVEVHSTALMATLRNINA